MPGRMAPSLPGNALLLLTPPGLEAAELARFGRHGQPAGSLRALAALRTGLLVSGCSQGELQVWSTAQLLRRTQPGMKDLDERQSAMLYCALAILRLGSSTPSAFSSLRLSGFATGSSGASIRLATTHQARYRWSAFKHSAASLCRRRPSCGTTMW